MAEFSVMPANARKKEEDLTKYANLLADYADQVVDIKNSLGRMGSSTGRIKANLQGVANQMTEERQKMETLRAGLIELIELYESTEKGICNQTNVQPQEGGAGSPSGGVKDFFSDMLEDGLQDLLKDLQDPKRAIVLAFLALNPAFQSLLSTYLIPFPENDGVRDYILDALEQVLLGDFSDESNLLGTALSVAIGFVPIVGQIADVRDLIADIYHLIDDGPTTEEWVALGFTAIGLIPGLGDVLKHGDEAANLVKGLLKNANHADEAADVVKRFMRKGDSISSAVGDRAKGLKRSVTGKIDDLIDSGEMSRAMKEWVGRMKNGIVNSSVYRNVDNILENKLKLNFENASASAKDFIEEMLDGYKGDLEEGLVTELMNWIMGDSVEAEPVPAT